MPVLPRFLGSGGEAPGDGVDRVRPKRAMCHVKRFFRIAFFRGASSSLS